MARAADFFVSYTGADRAWAEWVAWQLEQAGYQVIIQAWDFEPGDNFVVRMRDALEHADRALALISAAYLASPYCTDEWTGAFLHDPDGRNRLLQVRIENCELPRLLRAQVYIDLVGLPRQQAKAQLLAGVQRGRRKPPSEPPFPHDRAGTAGPRFPGHSPEVTNLPPRNADFAGRAALLEELHGSLTSGGHAAVVQAATVHGLGGVGKTQLALEYAHRYASDYDVIWWVPAEQPLAIPGLLGGLARRVGVPEQAEQAELLASLWDELRERDRWLLIYDNAQGPKELAPYRPPAGAGHVLVTSRTPTWGTTAAIRLDVLKREEAVAFLRRRTGSDNMTHLPHLAEALGDLPLALEQAAAYLDETKITPAAYLALYEQHGAELLAQGEPLSTEQTVVTTWQVALGQLDATPGAPELLALCAFLAPDNIPRAMFGEHAQVLPEPLDVIVERPLALNPAVGALGHYSLVTVTEDSLTVHRLVQTVVRASLSPDDQRQWAAAAARLVNAAFPHEGSEVAAWEAWPACALLLPHALVVADHAEGLEVEAETTASLRSAAGWYLWSRGQYRQALALEEQALAARRRVLGEDHPDTLDAINNLGQTRRDLGDLDGARELHEQGLAGCRRVLGEDHPDTLTSMNNLAAIRRGLGDLDGARQLHEQTLAGLRRVLGEDHPDTLTSMDNLAKVHRELGDLDGARRLHEQALAGFRRVLGEDHPDTLKAMNNLAETGRALGDLDGARELHEQALAARRGVLGEDHPDTLTTMNNLALTRQALGDLEGARDLQEQALAGRRRVLGEDHPDTVTSMNSLAAVHRELGEL
jgi:tetratricopeptide (TPR) repeat protein